MNEKHNRKNSRAFFLMNKSKNSQEYICKLNPRSHQKYHLPFHYLIDFIPVIQTWFNISKI